MSYVLGIAVVRLVEGRFFLFEHPFGDEFSEAAAAGRGEEIPGGGARGRFRRAGDSAAREKLIEHNLRLVAHVAKKYAGAAEADDLLSVGSIGLIKAINTYEPNKGTQLATYTAKCIENEILMLLRANKKFKNNVSLSEVVGTDKDGNELMLIDLLCEKDDSVFQKVEKAIQNEKFTELVRAVLTEREFKIITLRYGLKGGRCHPQREVALLMRISRSYVSRIEKKAVEKLKAAVKKEDFYL